MRTVDSSVSAHGASNALGPMPYSPLDDAVTFVLVSKTPILTLTLTLTLAWR